MYSDMLAGLKKSFKKDKFKKTKEKTQKVVSERSESFVDRLSELELDSNNLSRSLEVESSTEGI